MKKILFPTDFSDASKNAFRYALLLADQLKASVKVVHCTLPVTDVEPYGTYVNYTTDAYLEKLKKDTGDFVNNGITQVLEKLNNAPLVEGQVVLGTPVNNIVSLAKQEEFDIILMGSRGQNKSRLQKILGSVASGVVENAKCPVIIIPEDTDFKPLHRLAYATDLSDADPFEIWRVTKLLSPLTREVHVVHVRLPKEDEKVVDKKVKEMETFFEENCADIKVIFHNIPGLDLQVELNRFTVNEAPDLLVMYQPKHTLWNKILFKSNTRAQAAGTTIPLLVQKAG